jgi:hypothetical protein
VNLKNVPINDKDLQNFMIETTNRESEEVEVQNERILSPRLIAQSQVWKTRD